MFSFTAAASDDVASVHTCCRCTRWIYSYLLVWQLSFSFQLLLLLECILISICCFLKNIYNYNKVISPLWDESSSTLVVLVLILP